LPRPAKQQTHRAGQKKQPNANRTIKASQLKPRPYGHGRKAIDPIMIACVGQDRRRGGGGMFSTHKKGSKTQKMRDYVSDHSALGLVKPSFVHI
jgi:hypothetical protein